MLLLSGVPMYNFHRRDGTWGTREGRALACSLENSLTQGDVTATGD